MKRTGNAAALFLLLGFLSVGFAQAGGGALGIDHILTYDNSGIWKRSDQSALLDLLIGGEIVGAIWEGGEARLGTNPGNPNLWFQGKGHYSFPSGEVTAVTAITTPFVFEYAHDYPAVYALLLLPAYDSVARMKVQAHWQTDVLAGVALGAATSYFARTRDSPIILGVLPHGLPGGRIKAVVTDARARSGATEPVSGQGH